MNKITVVCHKDHDKGYENYIEKCLLCEVERLQKREWHGLSWEEIDECFKITPDQYLPAQIYKRIEAKLKEKNHDTR